jgi:ribonuclease HI
LGPDVNLDLTEYPNPHGKGITHAACPFEPPCPRCGGYVAHTNSLVIAVDGACRSNGSRTVVPRCALSVYVGESSKWNVSMILHNEVTNQVAELVAGIMGLKRATDIWESGEMDEIYEDGELRKELRHVVIKANSEYLVKGMTE